MSKPNTEQSDKGARSVTYRQDANDSMYGPACFAAYTRPVSRLCRGRSLVCRNTLPVTVLVLLFFLMSSALTGCGPQEREVTTQKRVRTVYYDGPELEVINGTIGVIRDDRARRVPPGMPDDQDEDWDEDRDEDWDEEDIDEEVIDEEDIDEDDENGAVAMAAGTRVREFRTLEPRGGFLQWAPREEGFLEWLPREVHQPDPIDGEAAGTLFAALFEEHEDDLIFADETILDFRDDIDIQDDPELEFALPVSGTGEAGGVEGGRTYSTHQDYRFRTLLDNWYVSFAVVDYYQNDADNGDANLGDAMAGIGLGVDNQGFYFDDFREEHRVYTDEMPRQFPFEDEEEDADDDEEGAAGYGRVSQLGLKLSAAPVNTGERRSIYFSRIDLFNARDEEAAMTITTNPEGAAALDGGDYNGWLVEVEDYIEGQILEIPSGPYGEMEYDNGDRYEGRWHDGLRHGTGTYIREDEMELRAEWKDGMAQNRGILTWFDGDDAEQEYTGFFKDNSLHGQGSMIWYDDNEPVQRYSGQWRDSQAYGTGSITFEDGREYTGGWFDGRMHGRGRMTFPDGRVYTGGFREGQPHGRGAMRLPEGLMFRGVWQNGEPTGRGVFIPNR